MAQGFPATSLSSLGGEGQGEEAFSNFGCRIRFEFRVSGFGFYSSFVPMKHSLRNHWPEYLMEAAELAIFMISASLFTILLYHPSSPVLQIIPAEFARRVLMGSAMGLTAIALIYSP